MKPAALVTWLSVLATIARRFALLRREVLAALIAIAVLSPVAAPPARAADDSGPVPKAKHIRDIQAAKGHYVQVSPVRWHRVDAAGAVVEVLEEVQRTRVIADGATPDQIYLRSESSGDRIIFDLKANTYQWFAFSSPASRLKISFHMIAVATTGTTDGRKKIVRNSPTARSRRFSNTARPIASLPRRKAQRHAAKAALKPPRCQSCGKSIEGASLLTGNGQWARKFCGSTCRNAAFDARNG